MTQGYINGGKSKNTNDGKEKISLFPEVVFTFELSKHRR